MAAPPGPRPLAPGPCSGPWPRPRPCLIAAVSETSHPPAAGARFQCRSAFRERARRLRLAGPSRSISNSFQRVGSGEVETVAVVVPEISSPRSVFSMLTATRVALACFCTLCQRFAKHLQHLGGHFLRQAQGGVGSRNVTGMPLSLLEGFGAAPAMATRVPPSTSTDACCGGTRAGRGSGIAPASATP